MPTERDFPANDVAAALGGRFEIRVPAIGAGAQGLVYRGRRIQTPSGSAADDPVALKLYVATVESERIEREIALLESIRHPALAQVLEHGIVRVNGQDVRYVAWEYIRGEALDVRLQGGALPPKVVAIIGRDISGAIGKIWERTVVHRDVKPANILLRNSEIAAVLIDLGIARHLAEPSLTAYGMTWGTQGYMSPEQCRIERRLTCKSDLYSLGVVLQQALLGRHPTDGDQRRLATSPPKTSSIAPTAPGGLAGLIDSLLQLRPVFRPDPLVISDEFARAAHAL